MEPLGQHQAILTWTRDQLVPNKCQNVNYQRGEKYKNNEDTLTSDDCMIVF